MISHFSFLPREPWLGGDGVASVAESTRRPGGSALGVVILPRHLWVTVSGRNDVKVLEMILRLRWWSMTAVSASS